MKSYLLACLSLIGLAAPAFAVPCPANDPTLLLPNLVALEPQRVRVMQRRGVRQLQFVTRIENLGPGPFHLMSQSTETSGSAKQILHRADGTTCERVIGTFPIREDDQGLRLPNYAQYFVRADNPLTGRIVARGALRSYCIADVTPIDTDGERQIETDCSDPASIEEGLSVGWADVYDTQYPEQSIPLDTEAGSVEAGEYYLVVIPDPTNLIAETDNGSTSGYGVIKVKVPARIGDGPVPPPENTPEPTATTRPRVTPTAPSNSGGEPTARPRPTVRPVSTHRPRRTLPPRPVASRPPRPTRTPVARTPEFFTPTPGRTVTATSSVPPPTATSTATTPRPTATPTARTPRPTPTPTPRPPSGLALCSPELAAEQLTTRMWRMYYAYPGNTRSLTVSASINLGRNGAPLDPIRQPVGLALLDHRKNLMLEMRDLRFTDAGNGNFAASTPQGMVTLQPITGGYNFNFQFDDPTDELIIPQDLWSGSQTLCFAVGNRRVYEPFVCQIKPNNGFLCHDNH